eukprot:4848475-Amphidinium_carterae.1
MRRAIEAARLDKGQTVKLAYASTTRKADASKLQLWDAVSASAGYQCKQLQPDHILAVTSALRQA